MIKKAFSNCQMSKPKIKIFFVNLLYVRAEEWRLENLRIPRIVLEEMSDC